MTVDELCVQCLTLTPNERFELLCFVISQTVKDFDGLGQDWKMELADRSAALSAGDKPWRPSMAFMARFRERCTAA